MTKNELLNKNGDFGITWETEERYYYGKLKFSEFFQTTEDSRFLSLKDDNIIIFFKQNVSKTGQILEAKLVKCYGDDENGERLMGVLFRYLDNVNWNTDEDCIHHTKFDKFTSDDLINVYSPPEKQKVKSIIFKEKEFGKLSGDNLLVVFHDLIKGASDDVIEIDSIKWVKSNAPVNETIHNYIVEYSDNPAFKTFKSDSRIDFINIGGSTIDKFDKAHRLSPESYHFLVNRLEEYRFKDCDEDFSTDDKCLIFLDRLLNQIKLAEVIANVSIGDNIVSCEFDFNYFEVSMVAGEYKFKSLERSERERRDRWLENTTRTDAYKEKSKGVVLNLMDIGEKISIKRFNDEYQDKIIDFTYNVNVVEKMWGKDWSVDWNLLHKMTKVKDDNNHSIVGLISLRTINYKKEGVLKKIKLTPLEFNDQDGIVEWRKVLFSKRTTPRNVKRMVKWLKATLTHYLNDADNAEVDINGVLKPEMKNGEIVWKPEKS